MVVIDVVVSGTDIEYPIIIDGVVCLQAVSLACVDGG